MVTWSNSEVKLHLELPIFFIKLNYLTLAFGAATRLRFPLPSCCMLPLNSYGADGTNSKYMVWKVINS